MQYIKSMSNIRGGQWNMNANKYMYVSKNIRKKTLLRICIAHFLPVPTSLYLNWNLAYLTWVQAGYPRLSSNLCLVLPCPLKCLTTSEDLLTEVLGKNCYALVLK